MLIVYGRDTSKSNTYLPVNLKTGCIVRISQASKVAEELKEQALEALKEIKKQIPANIDLQLRKVPERGPLIVYS